MCSSFKIHFSSSLQTFVTAVSFTVPSLSLLKKLTEGGINPLKAAKVLLEQGKIGADVALLLDEVYLQKYTQYQDGKLERKFVQRCYDIHDKQLKEVFPICHKCCT